ncbi:MAG: Trk system potassium transporter TrkA [Clostridia bacterium]|nr:Trk system potassium transporter TrkA [Clostridia bacterium]
MNIIIVGCGKVGSTLAAQLNAEGNNVTIIDQDAIKVKTIANKLDIMGVIGNGASRSVQKDAGVDKTDLLIAVTGNDELNLLSCLVAKKSSNCKTIARLKNPEYNMDAPYFKNELGLAMVINPELAAAKEIARILNFPSAIKIETFAKGRVELLKFKLPENSPLVGMSVKDVAIKLRSAVTFCTIERGEEVYIANGNFVFEGKDVISIIASPVRAKAFFKKIDYQIQPIKDALIVGGGPITYYLCDLLDGSGIDCTVVEKDFGRCNELATEFEKVTVINADPADEDTLREEGIAHADAFVALTTIDEENILLSLFAKKSGSRKLITKINRIDFDDITSHLDLDSIVYPKNITADTIVSYVRAMNNRRGSNIETVYNLIKGRVEAAEFTVGEGSPIVGKPLMELSLKPGVLIANIQRGRAQITPRGQDVIEPGDSVVIITKDLHLTLITDILKK